MTVYVPQSPGNTPGSITAGGNITAQGQLVSANSVWLNNGYTMLTVEGGANLPPVSSTMWFGIGVPAVGTGSNGDFAFRYDGTEAAHTLMYHKEAGAWVAMAA